MNDFDGAIGIDLGTTYSCAAVWQNDEVEIVLNEQGGRTTPSYVLFDNKSCLVGEPAKSKIVKNEQITIHDVKQLIGRQFTDESVQNDMKHWPFKVIDRGDNTPVVEVRIDYETETFTAEEISAKILEYLKKAAEKYLGESVKKAVISVPANFNNAQREATKKAGELAGFEVLQIINEPTAAAVAYRYKKVRDNKKRNVLVYDLGGGTFDVTVLTVENGEYIVKATGGDTHLGGEDFNKRLVTFVNDEVERRNGGVNVLKKQGLTRLRVQCENVKRNLSVAKEAELFIDNFVTVKIVR